MSEPRPSDPKPPGNARGDSASRRGPWLVVGLVALLVLALTVWWFLGRSGDAGGPDGAADDLGGVPGTVELYFPGSAGMLVAETRELADGDDPEVRLAALARALLEGPTRDDLFPPMPEGVAVGSVSLGDSGVVYIDLVREDGAPPPAGGSTEERLRVYSVVDTLVLNVEGARSAVVLWNGAQPESLSGHLDLSRPLLPDRSLIASQGGGGGAPGAP